MAKKNKETVSIELPTKLDIAGTKVIEGGKTVVRPDVIQAVTQLASLAQLVKIRKSLEREQFVGRLDWRTFDATEQRQWLDLIEEWPHTPWATAYFLNKGASTVKFALNRIDNEYELDVNEDVSIDFTKGEERIHRIFYWCDPGGTATLKVLGKY